MRYYILQTFAVSTEELGTLRSDNGDIHENVAEKWTSHPFTFFRDYSKGFSYLKEGNLCWSIREGATPEFRQRW